MSSDSVILEGFLCPICKHDLGTVNQLTAHFDEFHAGEDKDVLNQLKSLFDKAKRKLLKKDEVDDNTNPFTSEASSSQVVNKVTDVKINWDPQEIGAIRNHTDYMKRVRDTRIDHFAVETNKLLIRLDKLTADDVPDDPRQRKAYEKTVVPWVLDSDVNLCPSCGKSFGMMRRRHHCRLCGGIMCNRCSMFMPVSYAHKLINPSYQYEGGGFMRSGSASSLNSFMSSEGEEHIRTCSHCRMLLERRDQLTQQRNSKAPFILLYERMQEHKAEANKLLPTFMKMTDALNAGETTYSLNEANKYRLRMMKLYESIDSLSKRIGVYGLDHEVPPSSTEQQLQRMVQKQASVFLQHNLMGLQSLPSEEEVTKLQEQRRQEIQRKIDEEKRAAAERERQRREEMYRKQQISPSTQSRGNPEGAEVVVTKASGWQPAEVDQKDVHDDPMIQQITIIRGYIKQAKQLYKWDEVAMLEENLKMLQQEYWKQNQPKT